MRTNSLAIEAVKRSIARLRDELGRQDRDRLDALTTIIHSDGRINLGRVLETIFPNQDSETAQTYFRQFRKRLAETASGVGIRFFLEVDTRKKTPANERWCWFTGEDSAVETVESLMREETEFVERSGQGGYEMRDNKIVIRYFLSYASEDDNLKNDLLKRLRKLLNIDSVYHYDEWQDRHILAGDKWKEQIEGAITKCHFGLLLVTSSFLGSSFITDHELPSFVARNLSEPEPDKRAVPVALEPLLLNGYSDLKGLQHTQIFFNHDRKAFSQLKGTKKDEFARELYQQIRQVIDLRISSPKQPAAKSHHRLFEQQMRNEIECAMENCRFVRTEAHINTLEKLDTTGQDCETTPKQRIDALSFLNEWVTEPSAPAYFALLGELGMGKTTTCLAFARDLLNQRKTSPSLPLPIYMDLRLLGERGAGEPSLNQILETVIQKKWQGGRDKIDLSPTDVIRLVQEEGALAIFDGLDEVLVHLTPSGEQRFLRELLRLLPPIKIKGKLKALPEGKKRGKLLFSCRTHYFRTMRDQKNLLLGEDREPLTANDYRALVLMPFSENQIIEYLHHTLPEQDPEKLLDLIRSVHNLTEMAERPYTLSIIAKEIPQIEQWKMEGKVVTGVTLYRHMVRSWLERDTGKHTLTPSHKQRLMEQFAAELWRSGRRDWSVDDLEQWLIDYLRSHPEIAAHYEGKDRELMKEDLRTATFLVRVGEDRFRFAHTSLLEFFLACHLHGGLLENKAKHWSIPLVSRETLDFIGQLFTENDSTTNKALASLRELLRSEEQPDGRRQSLAYTLSAINKKHPAPSLALINADGLDLRGWHFHGKSEERLNLCGSSWQGALLEGAEFHHTILNQAIFSGAMLARSEFIDCQMRDSVLNKTNLAGTIFRDCDNTGNNFTGSECHRTAWLRCNLKTTNGVPTSSPIGFLALSPLNEKNVNIAHSNKVLEVFTGHSSEVSQTIFSPDGNFLATTGFDTTIRIWDFESGQCIKILRGHTDECVTCCYSPNGDLLASAGSDGTIRIWRTTTGACLSVFKGHENEIMECAFAPDGHSLASAGLDGTVRLWDVNSGQCISKLNAHSDRAFSCAFSKDGLLLATAGRGNTKISIWNVNDWSLKLSLLDQEEGSNHCEFSPDGRYLVTSWGDIYIWDTTSWECTSILECEEGVASCCFSFDGQYLCASGYDGSVWIWKTDSWELEKTVKCGSEHITDCKLSIDNKYLVFPADHTIQVWDNTKNEYLPSFGDNSYNTHTCMFFPDGKTYITGGSDGILRIWDVNSSQCTSFHSGFASNIRSCSISPDGNHIVTSDYSNQAQIWDALNWSCLATLKAPQIDCCKFSPDGSLLVISTKEGFEIIDTKSWRKKPGLCVNTASIADCEFSPNSKLLALTGRGGFVAVYDLNKKKFRIKLLGHDGGVFSCSFSPDGKSLASAGFDKTIRIWDILTGTCFNTFGDHEDSIVWVKHLNDNQTILSAGRDGTIRTWNYTNNETSIIVRKDNKQLTDCAVSPDGKHVIAIEDDTTLSMWDIVSKREVYRNYILPNGNWSAIDPVNNRIIKVSSDAWRWLGWSGINPVTGRMERWPVEIFGALPE